ncbi:glycosyltransferase family 2 protein [Flavobacterium gilvum]|uniref:Glycosyltransferase 2-like domain-containing protein n=1 Tax=Flavobacterium gilvum TaxID=1492737 RepID=A0AAC9I861_9FLAO|nr:glycosyltransferase family 2 protein [Flavobacterium gilvum]AOW11043.1 hypothetical protein EM308_16980 [Flavobacterium gilvum]KFC57988.1 hypothetical protein FEM08_32270 [Flavobacterium gilvum]
MKIKISIIVATYNAQKYLQNCLDSIIPQLNESIELIIIDGGSKDETINIIKSNQQHISCFVTEPDKGIYDAWNKGIQKATADWIMFLGSDDVLLPNALHSYMEMIRNCEDEISIISSKVRVVTFSGKQIKIIGEKWDWHKYKTGTYSLAHPGMLHKKILFEKYGYYDIQFRICSDSEFFLRTGKYLKGAFVDAISVNMQEGGMSDSYKAIVESYFIRKKNRTIPNYCNCIRFFWRCGIFSASKIKRKILYKYGKN